MRIVITGAKGLIGRELFLLLRKKGNEVKTYDLKDGYDLTDYNTCLKICKNADEVYNLVGLKGSPKRTSEEPYTFMEPMLRFNMNMIKAAIECKVKKFLYTSSIAVLNPQTDRFPAFAKLAGEELINAYRIQYPKGTKFCIVRPANVFGRFDDLKAEHLMVVSSLIRKGLNAKSCGIDYFEVWGDGEQIRDFIDSRDVARGMILTMNKMPIEPINLCSGKGVKIKDIANTIGKILKLKVKFDDSKPVGDKVRLMPANGKLINFKPKIDVLKGVKEATKWKMKNFNVKFH